MIYPNGGEQLGDSVNVTWQINDVDSNNLTYELLYSIDAGKTWLVIAMDLKEQNYTVNLKELPGGSNGLFKAIVTDGVNTVTSESNAVFNVPDKPPNVRIISPGNDSNFTTDQTVVFVGEGYDIEDIYLDNSSVRWSSDKQGILGSIIQFHLQDWFLETTI